MKKHPRNVSKRFQKDISSGTKDIKQFSQLITHTHTQTHTHTDTRTSVNLELTPPEVGQLKMLLNVTLLRKKRLPLQFADQKIQPKL